MDIRVYGPLRSATGEKTVTLDVAPETVGDVVDAFVEQYPRLRSQLYTDDGALRPSVRVMRDDERVDVDAPCSADASLALFPAMQGGGSRVG